MASVRKLRPDDPASPWVCEYTNPATGKRHRITPKTGLKKDADAARRKVEAEIEGGAHVAVSQTVTVKEAVQAWLNDCERRWKIKDRMAGSTLAAYRSKAKHHVIPVLGHIKVSQLTSRQMQDFIDSRSKTIRRNTLAGFVIVLTQMLNFSVDRGWLAVSPLTKKRIRLPQSSTEKVAIPSREELSKIFKVLSERAPYENALIMQNRALIVLLGAFSGMRRGEIVGLQWDNVDLTNERLNIRHSLSVQDGLKGPKTKHSYRTVPLAPQVAEALRSLQEASNTPLTGYVLKTRNGTAIDPRNVYELWAGVMKKAGLVEDNEASTPLYNFHCLRHVYVTLLIALGLQPLHIQKLVGHASISTTMNVYGHLFPSDDSSRAAVSAAAAQFDVLRPIALAHQRSQPDATQARLPPPSA
ncbi:site-specific integrase [Methylobacterium sp. DB1607]|nr:site-specific integrase [Methylobacterium sp. DB1607]